MTKINNIVSLKTFIMKILDLFLSLFGYSKPINTTEVKKERLTLKEMQNLLYLNGTAARDNGIKQAEENANRKNKGWTDLAYGFLLGYAQSHDEFMIEEIRAASIGSVPEPPSNRAWGTIAVRAAKDGFITRKGFKSVSNVKAHRTPATLWSVNK